MDGLSRNTLPKKERLCGKTSISMLLAKGRHGNVPGLRFCYLIGNGSEGNRIMVSAPKKLFKRAVKRNLLKRRLRESFRKQKHDLGMQKGIDLLITYSTKDILSYEEIYTAVGQVIAKVNKAIEKKAASDEGNAQ
jgi:ribonuclease P protein component